MGMGFAMIHKEHKNSTVATGSYLASGVTNAQQYNMVLVGKVRGRTCILIDDIADTCNTIVRYGTDCLCNRR